MATTDPTTENNLYVTRLIDVVRSSMRYNGRIVNVDGRHSDACIFILTGSCAYEFENGGFSVKAGDILYLANNSSYKMTVGNGEYKVIYCDFEYAASDDIKRQSFVCTPRNPSEAENIFKRMFRIHNSASGERFNSCMACLYSILAIIADSRDSGDSGSRVNRKMKEAKMFIERNAFDPSFSVYSAAAHSEMSEAYFRRLFRSIYHMPPSKYIKLLRVERAKKLLSYQFMTISDCASQCGFSSVQYFTRVFREMTGITPSQFRKQ